MGNLISLSPTVLVNPEMVSAVEMVSIGGTQTLAVYVDGRVFTTSEKIEEILAQLKSAQVPEMVWAGK
jgi:hypothetical protein